MFEQPASLTFRNFLGFKINSLTKINNEVFVAVSKWVWNEGFKYMLGNMHFLGLYSELFNVPAD